jgi:hypothetical protein
MEIERRALFSCEGYAAGDRGRRLKAYGEEMTP